MDVSYQAGFQSDASKITGLPEVGSPDVQPNGYVHGQPGIMPSGESLIHSIVSLTGLPDGAVREELNQILQGGAAQGSASVPLENVSLEQLRSAMLVYLESIHADMISKEPDCTLPTL